jgi:hypothetical protein
VLLRVLTLLALLGYSLYVLYSTLLALSTVSEGQGPRAGYPRNVLHALHASTKVLASLVSRIPRYTVQVLIPQYKY